MIKIQDSWGMTGLVFPQMVNKALVNTLEDWLWENVWSYKLKYRKKKNKQTMNDDIHAILIFILNGIYVTTGVKVASSSVTHLTVLLRIIWSVSSKFFFPIWDYTQLSFREL